MPSNERKGELSIYNRKIAFAIAWVILRSSWLGVVYISMLALEKFVDLKTGSVEKIVWVTIVYYGTTLMAAFVTNKIRRHVNMMQLLLIVGTVLLVSSFIVGKMPYYVAYLVMVIISLVDLCLVPSFSTLLEKGVMHDDKSRVLAWSAVAGRIVGVVSLFGSARVLTSFMMVLTYFWISVGLIAVAMLTLFVCIKCKKRVETTPNDEKAVFVFSSFVPVVVFSLFAWFKIFYVSFDPINQGYLREILQVSGVEHVYTFSGWYFIGGFIVSFFITWIEKRFSLLLIFGVSFLMYVTYLVLLQEKIGVSFISISMLISGMVAVTVNTVTSIRIHQSYTGVMLARHMNAYQVISSLGPFISLVFITRLIDLYPVLEVGFIMAIVAVITMTSSLSFLGYCKYFTWRRSN